MTNNKQHTYTGHCVFCVEIQEPTTLLKNHFVLGCQPATSDSLDERAKHKTPDLTISKKIRKATSIFSFLPTPWPWPGPWWCLWPCPPSSRSDLPLTESLTGKCSVPVCHGLQIVRRLCRLYTLYTVFHTVYCIPHWTVFHTVQTVLHNTGCSSQCVFK